MRVGRQQQGSPIACLHQLVDQADLADVLLGEGRTRPAYPCIIKANQPTNHHLLVEVGMQRVVAEAHLAAVGVNKPDG